jgi:hypothetical protein
MADPAHVFSRLEAEAIRRGNIELHLMMFGRRCCCCGNPCQQYIKFYSDETGPHFFTTERGIDPCGSASAACRHKTKMDVRCACFERHYENWQNGGLAMEVQVPTIAASATVTLYGPQLTYWHGTGINWLSWNGSMGITNTAGSTIDVDLAAIFDNFSPFQATDFGRISYGQATMDGGDNLRGPMTLVTLTILTATTVRLTFAGPLAAIGQYQISLAWLSTITRDAC